MLSSCLLLTLAGLTKAQYLLIGAPILIFVVADLIAKRVNMFKLLSLGIYGTISIGITLLWYRYADGLSTKSGLQDFAIHAGQSFPQSLNKAMSIFANNLFIDLPETLAGYSLFVLFIIGIFTSFRTWRSKWAWPLAFWALMLLVYYVMELGQLEFHLYYLLPSLPFIVLIAAYGAKVLLNSKCSWALLLILIAAPLHTSLKIIPARWANAKAYPKTDLKNPEKLRELQNAVPNNAYCVVGMDDSGCILLYYLHKKGSTFLSEQQLLNGANGKIQLQDWISNGATYLYTDNKDLLDNEYLIPYFDGMVTEVGSFTVLKLKQTDQLP